jgi:glycosyltransferase involved in cell wall biosynthesis
LPFWETLLLRHGVGRLLFDLDDAVFLRDSYSPRGLEHPRRWRRFASLVRRCDAVVAGNTWLASRTKQAAPAVPVVVIPTCVEPADYTPTGTARAGVQLVWVGSSSTLQGLERIRPMLEAICRQVPDVSLKIVCDRFSRFDGLPLVCVPWRGDTEPAEIAAADVGISWVPDDDWSRGKCGLKVLQYMAAGLPVVANPVGVHPELVRHGETGFLATTEAEWVAALRTLAADAGLRRRMGQAGRALVERSYSVRAGASAWLDLLAALERGRKQVG